MPASLHHPNNDDVQVRTTSRQVKMAVVPLDK